MNTFNFVADLETIDNDQDEELSAQEAEVVLKANKDKETVISTLQVSGVKGKKFVDRTVVAKRLNNGLYQLSYKEAGIVPVELRGLFTSFTEVQSAVAHYKTVCNFAE